MILCILIILSIPILMFFLPDSELSPSTSDNVKNSVDGSLDNEGLNNSEINNFNKIENSVNENTVNENLNNSEINNFNKIENSVNENTVNENLNNSEGNG